MNDNLNEPEMAAGETPEEVLGLRERFTSFCERRGPSIRKVSGFVLGAVAVGSALYLSLRGSGETDDAREDASWTTDEEPELYGIPESEIDSVAKGSPNGVSAKVEGQRVTYGYTSNSKKTNYESYIYTNEDGVDGVNRGFGPRENISSSPMIFAERLDELIKQKGEKSN